jgi:hypothetical protein
MAAHAFAAGLESQAAMRHGGLGMESGVALQAELAAFAAYQEHVIGAAMGVVAGDAAFDLHGGVLEDVRPALFDVALHAGFPTGIIEADEVFRAMRIVAVGTLHQSFGNAVMLGQSKLRLHGEVAGVAQRGFGALQQAVVQPARLVGQLRKLEEIGLGITQETFAVVFHFIDQVRGVALIAGDAVAGVLRVREKLLLLAGVVAGQAARSVFVRGSLKGEQGVIEQRFRGGRVVAMSRLDGVGVGLRRAVTGLAAVDIVLARKS